MHPSEIVSVDEIIPGLWLGNAATAKNEKFIKENNIKLVLNCTSDIPNYFSDSCNYVRFVVDDISGEENIKSMNKILPVAVKTIKRNKGNVLVHCSAGIQRSAIVVAAYLTDKFKLTPYQAIEAILKKRPQCFRYGKEVNFKESLIKLISGPKMG